MTKLLRPVDWGRNREALPGNRPDAEPCRIIGWQGRIRRLLVAISLSRRIWAQVPGTAHPAIANPPLPRYTPVRRPP